MITYLRPDGSLGTTTAGALKTHNRSFKGWHCAAGFTSLLVNPRGDVWGSVCQSGPSYGNVYTGDFDLPKALTICDKASCFCTSDLKIPKGVSVQSLKELLNSKSIPSDGDLNPVAIRGTRTFTISWSLGYRCNYNCSYCSPRIHNNYSSHLPYEQWCRAWDLVHSKIAPNRIRLTIVGGEPTINPSYIDMITYASSPAIHIVTTTNGTASVHQLAKALALGSLTISIHQEYCDIDKMILKLRSLSSSVDSNHRINISYMMKPNTSHLFQAFKQSIPDNIHIEAVPIYDPNTFILLDYPPHEIHLLSNN